MKKPENKKKAIDKTVMITSILTAVLLCVLYFFRRFVPDSITVLETEIKPFGLVVFIVIFVVSNYIAAKIFEIDKEKPAVVIGILGGAVIFYSQLMYKIFLNLIILNDWININWFGLIITSLVLSVLGLLLAYNKGLRLKGEKIWVSGFLIVGYFLVIVFLVSKKYI